MKTKRLVNFFLTGLVVFASLSFITSTLAWYASSSILEITNIVLELKAERELLISRSAEESTFKEKLDNDDFDEVGLFSPVSTMFESRWLGSKDVPEFYEYADIPFIEEDGTPSEPKAIELGYLKQEIYLLGDDDLYVSIDPLTTYFNNNEEANEIYAEIMMNEYPSYTKERAMNELNQLVNALRFSIYDVEAKKYFIIDPNKNGTTYYGGVLDNDKDDYFDVYTDQNGNKKEIIYGEVNDRTLAVYQDVGDEDIVIDDESKRSTFNANHRSYTEMFLPEESLSNGLTIKSENSVSLDDLESTNINVNPVVIELQRYVPKKLILSIYLEGWDLDCINTTMGGNFLAQIQFKILREM